MPEAGKSCPHAALWRFLALVFPLSWALWVPVMLDKTNPIFLNLSGGPALAAIWIAPAHDAKSKSMARLLAFAALIPVCWLVCVANVAINSSPPASMQFRAALLLPSAIPAWIISGAFSADSGVRRLLSGLVRPANWYWPLVALLLVPAFLLTTAVVGHSVGLPVVNPVRDLSLGKLGGISAIQFLHYFLFTSVGEEPGWRGFLLVRLQTRFSPLLASVFVWLPWAIWHLPLDLGRHWNVAQFLEQRVIILLIYSILLTWLYNRSGGSLLVVAIVHGGTGSFLYLLPSSPTVMVPLAVVLLFLAVFFGRMWQQLPRPDDAKTPSSAELDLA